VNVKDFPAALRLNASNRNASNRKAFHRKDREEHPQRALRIPGGKIHFIIPTSSF
jgi:hypothetical protein